MSKRINIVAVVAVFASGFAGVNEAAAQQNMLGIKGGLVSATVTDVDEFDANSRSGIGLGAFLQVNVGGHFSIQPEVLYLAKGFSGFDEVEDFDLTVKTKYLQVPVLVQYHIPTGGMISPRLFAGPSIALELGCDAEAEFDGVTAEATCEEGDIQLKSSDFGVVLGGGVDIPAGGVVVTLDGRYDLGVTKINEGGGDQVSIKNRAWELFAGIGFPVGF